MPQVSDAQLREILSLDTIAVIGASTTPGKDARLIPKYLIANGYDVIPVNPTTDEVLGRHSYPSLSAVEEDIDIVDVFRPSNELPGIVDEAIDRDDLSVLWAQSGISHDEAAARARDAGITVIQNRCIRIQHQRLFGDEE